MNHKTTHKLLLIILTLSTSTPLLTLNGPKHRRAQRSTDRRLDMIILPGSLEKDIALKQKELSTVEFMIQEFKGGLRSAYRSNGATPVENGDDEGSHY